MEFESRIKPAYIPFIVSIYIVLNGCSCNGALPSRGDVAGLRPLAINSENAADSIQSGLEPAVKPGDAITWQPVELCFKSRGFPQWHTFPLQVTFRHGTRSLTLDGYWDGGQLWKVRFTPTESGTWTWISTSTDDRMKGISGTITAAAPTPEDIRQNPNFRGHVRVSGNNRYFEYADGTPFFWIGDTNWALPYDRCGIENGNFYAYLNDRKAKKFTVIQMQYLSPTAKNEGGIAITSYPGSCNGINPKFFQSMDIRIKSLWENGFVVAGHPTWFSEITITREEAQQISRYVMARYGAYNLIWSLTGEYQTSYKNPGNDFTEEDYNLLGGYIQRHNKYSHPVSVHPRSKFGIQSQIGYSSSREFHNACWLDHNWIQTYFYINTIIQQIQRDYNLSPAKPVVLSEGAYEGGKPKPEHAQNFAVVDRYLARLQAWTAYLNGAAGYSYGANGVWHMYDPSFPEPGIHQDYTKPWYEDLNLGGGEDMQLIRSFFSGLEWNTLRPLRSRLLVNGQTAPLPSANDLSPPSAIGKPAQTYIVYIPKNNTNNTIEIADLARKAYTAQWYNPRNGEYSDISGAPAFVSDWTIPSRPDTEDWVVVLKAKKHTSSGDRAANSRLGAAGLFK